MLVGELNKNPAIRVSELTNTLQDFGQAVGFGDFYLKGAALCRWTAAGSVARSPENRGVNQSMLRDNASMSQSDPQ
ncbi:MAG: hypothetical protein U1D55_03390 [Phycisphaerae bacterium]